MKKARESRFASKRGSLFPRKTQGLESSYLVSGQGIPMWSARRKTISETSLIHLNRTCFSFCGTSLGAGQKDRPLLG